jgi:hypothetical protein
MITGLWRLFVKTVNHSLLGSVSWVCLVTLNPLQTRELTIRPDQTVIEPVALRNGHIKQELP